MKHYEVNITNDALQDMENIYNYIAGTLQSPINALGQYNRIAKHILKLDTFPEKYTKFDFKSKRNMVLHRMIVDNYSIFYHIGTTTVTVTNVIYNGSDIQSKLKKL